MLKGYGIKYLIADYIKESAQKWWSNNRKIFIKNVVIVFLAFLPIILIIIYAKIKGMSLI